MKNIFELLNKREQYIEEKNIIDNYYKHLIPINDKYFIINNENSIRIEKKTKNKSTEIIYYKHLEKEYELVNKILKTTKKDNSFYILQYIKKLNHNFYNDYSFCTDIIEMEILNLDKDIKVEVNFNKIKSFDSSIDLLVLSSNKNIITISNNLFLYDETFDKKELIFNDAYDIFKCLKINENTFIFSFFENKYNLSKNNYIMKIEDDLIEKNIIENCGPFPIYYNNDKKILFSLNNNKICLTNFNTFLPKVIQTIETNYYNIIYNSSINYLRNINDDIIFLIAKNNDLKYYEVEYIIQYKIIKDELKEISRIELDYKKNKNC